MKLINTYWIPILNLYIHVMIRDQEECERRGINVYSIQCIFMNGILNKSKLDLHYYTVREGIPWFNDSVSKKIR